MMSAKKPPRLNKFKMIERTPSASKVSHNFVTLSTEPTTVRRKSSVQFISPVDRLPPTPTHELTSTAGSPERKTQLSEVQVSLLSQIFALSETNKKLKAEKNALMQT
jgi:hypothetical protein